MAIYLATVDPHSRNGHLEVSATANALTAVTIPADTRGATISLLNAAFTGQVSFDWNPKHTRATRVGTFADVGVEDETITIGSTVYTLKETVSDTAFEVEIGDDVTESATNLVNAIMGISPGIGYGSLTTPHPLVTASNVAGAVTVRAKLGGTGGNSIATTETSAAHFSWAGATLTGGANDDTGFGIVLPFRFPIEVTWRPLAVPPVAGLFNSDAAVAGLVNFEWLFTTD